MDCILEKKNDGLWYCVEEQCCWGPLTKKSKRNCSAYDENAYCHQQKIITQNTIIENTKKRDIILVLGIHSSLSSCLAECLEHLGVWMGQNTIGGEDRWLLQYCSEKQPFPSLYPNFSDSGCGGCTHKMDLGSWLRLQLHLTKDKGCPIGLKFPTLCAWGDYLKNIENHNNIRFKIIHIDRPLEESIQSAYDRTERQPTWGGNHMVDIPLSERKKLIKELQEHLYNEKNKTLLKRESFNIKSLRLLEQTNIVIKELVNWLNLNFDYNPSKEQINKAINSVKQQKAQHAVIKYIPEWIKNTTIIIKAFERPQYLHNLINSIYKKYPLAHIIVGDDGEKPECRNDTTIFHLPYDVGLSAGRNFLVDRVETPYILLLDDDYEFDERTNIEGMYNKLLESGYDIIAGGVDPPRRGINWLGHFKYDNKGGLYICRGATDEYKGIKKYDWAPNFFISKTEILKENRWNEKLKLAEQLDWFHFIKKQNIKLGYYNFSFVGHKTIDWFSYDNMDKRKCYSDKYYNMRIRAKEWIKDCVKNNNIRGDECASPLSNLPKILDKLNFDCLPIPKRIHQIWIGEQSMPEVYNGFCQNWKALHKMWDYRLWGDTDSIALMNDELLDLYNSSKFYAQKADLMRLLIIYYYGGIYLDTDFQPLDKLDNIILGKDVFVVQATREGEITNAVFGAVPYHPFILELINNISKYWDFNKGNSIGPPMFREIFNSGWIDKVYKFPMGIFYPYEWSEKNNKERFNKENYKNAVAVHHFAASWHNKI